MALSDSPPTENTPTKMPKFNRDELNDSHVALPSHSQPTLKSSKLLLIVPCLIQSWSKAPFNTAINKNSASSVWSGKDGRRYSNRLSWLSKRNLLRNRQLWDFWWEHSIRK